MNFTLSTEFKACDLEAFLISIWGKESPLTHVCELYCGHGRKENKGLYAVIKHDNKIVGCAGIKFVSGNQIEFGSLAISKEYRGLGLSEKLFAWRQNTVRKQVKMGHSVVTYATVGSTVMNFIIPKMAALTNTCVYPLNVALGVIPISKENAAENIPYSNMVVSWKGKQYTSTIAIVSTKNTAFYEKLSGFARYDFESILPVKCVSPGQVELVEDDNVEVNIPGTRLVIDYIKSTNIRNFPKVSADRYHQIVVPMTSKFAGIHKVAREKYVVTGFNMINNILQIVYSNSDRNAVKAVTKYLKTLGNDAITRFVDIVNEMNRL